MRQQLNLPTLSNTQNELSYIMTLSVSLSSMIIYKTTQIITKLLILLINTLIVKEESENNPDQALNDTDSLSLMTLEWMR